MAAGRLQSLSKELPRLSRDRRVLVRSSVLLVASSCILGALLSWLVSLGSSGKGSPFDTETLLLAWETTLAESESFEARAEIIRTGGRRLARSSPADCRILRPGAPADEAAVERALTFADNSPLDESARTLLESLDQGLRGTAPAEALARLGSLPEDLPRRHEFLGDLRYAAGEHEAALGHYRAEAERTASPRETRYSRRSAVVAASRSGSLESLRPLLRDPLYRDAFSSRERLLLFAGARDYPGLASAVARHELRTLLSPAVVPAMLCALIWGVILLRFWEITRARLIAAALAFAAGVLSASLTLYAVLVQEEIQGFAHHPEDTPMSQFLYFLAGVALREETLKLLCAAPFAVYAARRRSEVEGMLLPALVGLGFAFQENIGYLQSGLSTYVAWIRFLTANVLHFALTGVAGYYLYRTILRKFHGVEDFLFAFIAVVFAHGVYNSVLAIPSLAEYAILGTILIALIAYRFFDPLRGVMDTRSIGRRVSPLGIFVVGSALLLCLVMIVASIQLPYAQALGTLASAFAGMAPLAFAFVSRFRDL